MSIQDENPTETSPTASSVAKAELVGSDRIALEFRIQDLVRAVNPDLSAGHCGGCYGCSGCNH